MEMINDPLTIAVPEKKLLKMTYQLRIQDAMILDQIKEKGNLNQIIYSEIVYTHSQVITSYWNWTTILFQVAGSNILCTPCSRCYKLYHQFWP